MYYTLGPVPYDEPCAQVGQADYHERALEECRRYKAQLERQFPDAYFAVKGFPHDFGTYYEVVVYGEGNAYIEDEAPANWEVEMLPAGEYRLRQKIEYDGRTWQVTAVANNGKYLEASTVDGRQHRRREFIPISTTVEE